MITLACIVTRPKSAAVKARITASCKAAGLRTLQWCTGEDAGALFLSALSKALSIIRQGGRATIVAQFSDVVAPLGASEHQDDFSDEEWRHSWKAYLEAKSIVFLAVDPGGVAPVAMSTRTSVIRSYQRATQALERAVEAARQAERRDAGEIGYFCGRPPYGYRVVKGRFVINKRQAAAVRTVFKATLAGKAGGEIIALLTGGRTPEYWDRKKIRRLLDHAPLYCTGAYSPTQGQPVIIEGVAFMPSSWLMKLRQVQEAREEKARLSLDRRESVPSGRAQERVRLKKQKATEKQAKADARLQARLARAEAKVAAKKGAIERARLKEKAREARWKDRQVARGRHKRKVLASLRAGELPLSLDQPEPVPSLGQTGTMGANPHVSGVSQ